MGVPQFYFVVFERRVSTNFTEEQRKETVAAGTEEERDGQIGDKSVTWPDSVSSVGRRGNERAGSREGQLRWLFGLVRRDYCGRGSGCVRHVCCSPMHPVCDQKNGLGLLMGLGLFQINQDLRLNLMWFGGPYHYELSRYWNVYDDPFYNSKLTSRNWTGKVPSIILAAAIVVQLIKINRGCMLSHS